MLAELVCCKWQNGWYYGLVYSYFPWLYCRLEVYVIQTHSTWYMKAGAKSLWNTSQLDWILQIVTNTDNLLLFITSAYSICSAQRNLVCTCFKIYKHSKVWNNYGQQKCSTDGTATGWGSIWLYAVVFDYVDAMLTDYLARWLCSLVEVVFHKLLASQGHRQNFEGVSFSTKVPKCVQCCFYIKCGNSVISQCFCWAIITSGAQHVTIM